MFRHLASQAHVIMNVSYRLFPETDLNVRGVVAYYASRLMPPGHTDPAQGPVADTIRRLLTRLLETWSDSTVATDAQLLGGRPDEFPRTEHAFDLHFPDLSPPVQAALYDLDRFLALVASPSDSRDELAPERGDRPGQGEPSRVWLVLGLAPMLQGLLLHPREAGVVVRKLVEVGERNLSCH